MWLCKARAVLPRWLLLTLGTCQAAPGERDEALTQQNLSNCFFFFFFHKYLVNSAVSSQFSNKLFHLFKTPLIHRDQGEARNGAVPHLFNSVCTKTPLKTSNLAPKSSNFLSTLSHLLVAGK